MTTAKDLQQAKFTQSELRDIFRFDASSECITLCQLLGRQIVEVSVGWVGVPQCSLSSYYQRPSFCRSDLLRLHP